MPKPSKTKHKHTQNTLTLYFINIMILKLPVSVFYQWSFYMKVSCILFVALFSLVGISLASTADAQINLRKPISVHIKNAGLVETLDEIQRVAQVKILLVGNSDGKTKFNLNADRRSLENVLKDLLVPNKLIYRVMNNTIVIAKAPLIPKPGRISGRVLDEKGEALPGASVKVLETGNSTQTSVDGGYLLNLQPGTYTLVFSYISFQTQRVTGVVVTESKNTPLNISLKTDAKALNEVVVSAEYKKASVAGLLARQKNASEVSNGISAEEISRTPDKNLGESLKRISGVSTVDNKFVIVRGIGERYNTATLDGIVLPSTETQTRNFSFDLIPTNLVENVVVSKTVTPDMNASFGGGLIQINTKDIPTENFISFGAGSSYNDQSTGKDFFSHERGRYDYLGFDDGRRSFPKDLMHTDRGVVPNIELTNEQFQQKVDAQSKRFTKENFTLYKYKAAPSQNYQFTIGRLIALDTTGQRKLGFTGSLTYRNTQSITEFDQQRRGDWNFNSNNFGAMYGFNTTLGAILNVGLELDKNRFSLRNTYTHLYDNTLVRTIGYDNDTGSDDYAAGRPYNRIQEVDDPTFTNLLQNKLSGQHQLGKTKIEWNLASTSIDRKEKDLGITTSMPVLVGKEYRYFYLASSQIEARLDIASRHNYHNQEHNYSWGFDASRPVVVGGIRNIIKTGYFGIQKKAEFGWQIAALVYSNLRADSLRYIPIAEMANPANFGANGYNYAVTQYFLNGYQGKSNTQAGYLMLDTRLMENLRLVWGVRGEYYKYTEIRNDQILRGASEFALPHDKAWRWLPSANLTYSPFSQLNIRAAMSSTVVRPELMDNSQFFRYDPGLGAQFGNLGLASTKIDSYDVKTEWFPGLGEILSVGAFYKKFDKPVELTFSIATGNINYYIENAASAKVYGLEFELRKNLGFIHQNQILNNLTVYGNLTLQKSTVNGAYKLKNTDPNNPGATLIPYKQERPMYGQSPYLFNAGLQYGGDRLGINITYNKTGYKTYIVSFYTNQMEYEMPRELMDAQISYRFFKKKLEIKLNAGNLFNSASTYFSNTGSYEPNPDSVPGDRTDNGLRLKPGFTNKFEEGDQIRISRKFGRTYSTSLTYSF
jgi:outer membrane receptor protein involved in Fe transport